MIKGVKIIVLLVLGISIAQAQQLPFYSNYLYKPFLYNPSFAGDHEATEIFALNRSQFSGFQGSPVLNVLAADSKLQNKKMYGGILVANQTLGITQNTNVMATYAYRANVNANTYLKFGLSIGMFDQNVNFSKIIVQNIADPNIISTQQRKTTIDGNAGVSFYHKNLAIGFSVPQLLAGKLNYQDNTNARAYYKMARHFATSVKYEIAIDKEKDMFVTPNAIIRMVGGAPIQYDAGCTFDWKEKFWIGAMYRSGYAVGINAGLTIARRYSVGYSYDYMIGNISKYAGISQEIMIAVKLGKLKYKKGDDTLSAYDKKIMELQREMDELKRQNAKGTSDSSKPIVNTNIVKANPTQFIGKNVFIDRGIYLLTNNVSNFFYSNDTPMSTGIYIVVESCFDKNYAEDESKRYASFGFPDSDVIIDKTTGFYYVIIETAENKEDAIKKVKEAKATGVPDVWIQILVK